MLPGFQEKLEREFRHGQRDATEGKEKYTSFSYPSHLEPRPGVVSKFKESYDDGFYYGKILRVDKHKHLKTNALLIMQK